MKTILNLIEKDQPLVQWKDCPYCNGRGWFLIHPFATGGSNGVGGPGNIRQCEVCERVSKYYDKHRCIPPHTEELIKATREADKYVPSTEEARQEINRLKEELKETNKENDRLTGELADLYERESDPIYTPRDGDVSKEFIAEKLQIFPFYPGDSLYVYYDIDKGFQIRCFNSTACLDLS